MSESWQNYCKISEEINQNASQKVDILVATKGQSVDVLAQLSQRHFSFYGTKILFGENKVQEFLTKYEKVDAIWHFIGTLQTNKVKYIIDKVDCIQSVSNKKLLLEIDKQAKKLQKVMKIFLELNVADEENKTGADFAEIEEMLVLAKSCQNVQLCGLMTMLPNQPFENNRKYYLQVQSFYDKIKAENNLQTLSMGMSNDYLDAVKFGSTMVRIGRKMFV